MTINARSIRFGNRPQNEWNGIRLPLELDYILSSISQERVLSRVRPFSPLNRAHACRVFTRVETPSATP